MFQRAREKYKSYNCWVHSPDGQNGLAQSQPEPEPVACERCRQCRWWLNPLCHNASTSALSVLISYLDSSLWPKILSRLEYQVPVSPDFIEFAVQNCIL